MRDGCIVQNIEFDLLPVQGSRMKVWCPVSKLRILLAQGYSYVLRIARVVAVDLSEYTKDQPHRTGLVVRRHLTRPEPVQSRQGVNIILSTRKE